MSMVDRTGERSSLFSRWHRQESAKRYLSDFDAYRLGMIDIDFVLGCPWCWAPLALIETQESRFAPKDAKGTSRLADRGSIPAFSLSYETNGDRTDIVQIRWRQLRPSYSEVRVMSPQDYFRWELGIHDRHEAEECSVRTV